jgi:hypothetical protein
MIETPGDPAIDINRLLWVLCRGLYALNAGEALDPAERLFLRVCEKRLATLLQGTVDD